jgi:cytochrome P450
MHLARMEAQAAITAVLDRLPNLRLDPEAESQAGDPWAGIPIA